MGRTPFSAILIVVVLLAVLGSISIAAQDRYTLQVPNGLAFSEFRGYENWQTPSFFMMPRPTRSSRTGTTLNAGMRAIRL